MTRADSSRRFGRIFGFVRCFGSGKTSVRHFGYDHGDVSFFQWEIGSHFAVRQRY